MVDISKLSCLDVILMVVCVCGLGSIKMVVE